MKEEENIIELSPIRKLKPPSQEGEVLIKPIECISLSGRKGLIVGYMQGGVARSYAVAVKEMDFDNNWKGELRARGDVFDSVDLDNYPMITVELWPSVNGEAFKEACMSGDVNGNK